MSLFVRVRGAAGLLVLAFALFGCSTAPSGPGWVTLIDGDKGLENFTQLGAANWTASGGSIWADKKSTDAAGILLSKNSYKDFEIYAEFWADEDANSGIYIRIVNTKVVNTKASYEVQIWDKSTAMATASLMPPAKAAPSFKAANRWNTFLITAKGPRMTVHMNGDQAVDVNDSTFPAGPIALQYNAGTIKFRKLMIKPL
ncbi:MAG: 3-keto-disaccharide hydrolase [Burkholderiales bacterium]